MFENADWNLIFVGLGALFALLLVIVESYQAYQKYIAPKKEEKRASKKKDLEKERSYIRQVTSELQRSLEERVKNNSFPDFCDVGWFHAPSDLKEKGKEYSKNYDLCVDLKTACEAVIILRLQELTKEHLPKTSKEYDLVSLLNNEDLTNLYMNGKEVTKRWIEKEYPRGLYEDIMGNLKDKETRLDHFFLRLNSTFQKDPVLERFRKEKANLIELGNEILNDLTHKEEEQKTNLKTAHKPEKAVSLSLNNP